MANLYNPYQYTVLTYSTVIASSISIVLTLIVISWFFYLRSVCPEKTNRVSLRCVFIACCMNTITTIFNITTVFRFGDTTFCRGACLIIMFSGVMCATFLAIVGINLVLIFVINIKANQRKLEWIYYPCVDGTATSGWMCWYGFVFFTVVIAVFCSIAALIKLLHEHRNLIGKFNNIANTSASIEASKTHVQHRKEYQINVFLKVVSRCILYTLVPFVCNICGFIVQLIMINPQITSSPGFGIALADTIMASLEGVFVGAIFLSDPVMTEFISSKYKAWKHKYLDEYSQVRKHFDGQIKIIYPPPPGLKVPPEENDEDRRSSIISTLSINRATSIVTPPATVHVNSYSSNLGDTAGYSRDIKTTIKNNQSTIIPMRRVTVSPSIYSKLTHLNHPPLLDGECVVGHPACTYESGASTANNNGGPSTPIYLVDPELNNTILFPYKNPKRASAIHWFLVHLGFKKSKQGTRHFGYQSSNIR